MTRRPAHKAFTLVEILLVVALIGVLMTTALAPIVYTVEKLHEVQREFHARSRERLLFRTIFEETRLVSSVAGFAPIRLVKGGELGSAGDDALVIWGSATTRRGLPAGCMVYRVLRSGVGKQKDPGLYRFILSPDRTPENVDLSLLKPEDASIVLKDIDSMTVEVYADEEWKEEYLGRLPLAMRIKLTRKAKNAESGKLKEETIAHEEWFPVS